MVEGDGAITLVPAPVVEDPWIDGAKFSLPASSFVWDASGAEGAFVGWDDDCGSIYRAVVPAPGTWRGSAVSFRDGCRAQLHGAPGGWLFTDLDENLLPRVAVVNDAGVEIDALVFPQGPTPRVSWGSSPGGARPPIAGWWDDADRSERMLFVWEPGALTEWLREPGVGEGGAIVALDHGPVLFLDGPIGRHRLMQLDGPGATPREIMKAPVSDFRVSANGRSVVAVRARGVWRIEVSTAPEIR